MLAPKTLVAPQAVNFARVVRDDAPSHHLFGWLVGPAPTSVLGSVACVALHRNALSTDRQHVSEADYALERSTLDALLPVGVDVVGCYWTHDTDSATLAAAARNLVAEFGVADEGQHFLVATLAQRDVFGAGEPQNAIVWQWASGAQPAPAVSVDAAALKRFHSSTVPVTVRCSFAAGHQLEEGQFVVAVDNKPVSTASKQALAALWPRAGVADPHAVDVSRQLAVLRRRVADAEGVVPQLTRAAADAPPHVLDVTAVGYFAPSDTTVAAMVAQLVAKLNRIEWVWRVHFIDSTASTGVYQPPGVAWAVQAFQQRGGDVSAPMRRDLARRLGVSPKHVYFRVAQRVERLWLPAPAKLLDVHSELLSSHGVKGATLHCIEGHYEYCHYMQDKFNDDGWGCAYRSLQSIVSWLRLQGYTNGSTVVPTHAAIQEALVSMGDKEATFIGSKQWIGAIEISMILGHWFQLDCRTVYVSSGADVASHLDELCRHFEEEKSPIMVGGGVLAWTLLGVARAERAEDCRYLILDPHYTGADDLKTIVKKGWIAWKPPTVFRKDSFYNFCCPLIPKET